MVGKSIKIAFLVMIFGLLFAYLYDKIAIIKSSTEAVLDPTAGFLLAFNPTIGMIVITAIVSVILTLVQKYTTDQVELRKLRSEQKLLQEEMKKYKDHPQKLLELNKKQMEFIPKTFDLTMGSLAYTALPIFLFFRWFSNYFTLNPTEFFGFMSWFWAYLVLSVIFSMIYRKVFDMP